MKYREVLIEDDKTLADSGTLTTDIKIKDWITQLIIDFSLTNGVSTVEDEPPWKALSKIELVDGGKTYHSVTGPEAMAAACFDKGRWPPTWICERAGYVSNVQIPLMFGRYLGDPLFGFDPTKLTNPQLKVTWAKAAGHLDDSLRLGVWAKVVEDIPAPPEVLFWKTIQEFDSASSGVKTVDLPVDYPYRRLMIRAYKHTQIPEGILTKFKMDCDVGKFIPFELDEPEFSAICEDIFGPFQYTKMDYIPVSVADREIWMGGKTIAIPSVEDWNICAKLWASGCSYYVSRYFCSGTPCAPNVNVQVLVKGTKPQSALCYQFGLPNNPETWFPAPDYGDIDLKLTQGIKDATCSAVLQQPRTLP